jgi:Methyl-accepting chemotaxis protein (MCP) signalling domain/Single Cache domain 2
MRKLIEFIGAPALYCYFNHGLAFVYPASLVITIAITVVSVAGLELFGTGTLFFLWALSLYMSVGQLYFIKMSRLETRRVLDSGKAGGWDFSEKVVSAQWRKVARIRQMIKFGSLIKQFVGQISLSSDRILVNAKELSSHSDGLAHRAEDIAAMLEQTASGMEEFSATIERNAMNCAQATERTNAAIQAISGTSTSIAALGEKLHEVNAGSARVVSILNMIEGMAIQTNMLALSASIEAARAGEHGKGFALVAAEVRQLSQRSSDASKVVRERIEQSRIQMGSSVDVHRKTENEVIEMLAKIRLTNNTVESIASASAEQSTGIAQVKMAIEHMATLTQANAAAVDETAKLSSSLASNAHQLDASLGHFQAARYNNEVACVSLVKQAITHFALVGATKASSDFTDPRSAFHVRDLFVVLGKDDCTTVAHGGDSSQTNSNGFHRQDVNGRYFVRELAQTANTKGSGWVSYRVINPINRREQNKRTYVEKIPGTSYWICCGVFTSDAEQSAAKPAAMPQRELAQHG